MQIETRHPILFLSDASPNVTVPEVTGESFVVASEDCLCFCVLSFVDGASLVTVTDREDDLGGTKMFSGSLYASTGILAVSDSEAFEYIRIPVPVGQVSVDVWADDHGNTERVWIKLGAIRNH
ncbi:hypothetical protein ACSBOB_23070 [Mesorhizobium sp. ASY16-5R]|uniref:hypothetical protein n=1 Tax=Mesorhizobium sp. ASY16-5R TaxID=3445772 RepID=UPI003F9EDFF7